MRVREGDLEILHFDGHSLSVIFGCREQWSLALQEISVIGEYTTDGGPIRDNWYVVFVPHDGKWFDVRADMPSVAAAMDALGVVLCSPIALGLANSTTYASRVIWPRHLMGRPLFTFQTTSPGSRLLRAIGLKRVGLALTNEVAEAAKSE